MTACQIIDGKAIAELCREQARQVILRHCTAGAPPPGLVLLHVGEDPGSAGYVRSKQKRGEEIGMAVVTRHLPATITQAALHAEISALNADPAVHGILLQLPLPPPLQADLAIDAIHPDKDVDGLHPINLGRLAAGREALAACTPLGCMRLIASQTDDLRGRRAVVLGRSRLVGLPMAHLLSRAGATVTLLHSQSRDCASICREADLLVSATGQPELVRGDWIKAGAIVIDVGQTRVGDHLVGDVAFDEAVQIASAITPVLGGVGPMTIAMLLQNSVTAWCRQLGLDNDPRPD